MSTNGLRFGIIFPLLFFIFSSTVNADNSIASVYKMMCTKCHGADGKASKRGKNLGSKDFNTFIWQESITDGEIINTIIYGKNKMPGYEGRLSQNEIKGLGHYVRILLPAGQREKMPDIIKKIHYSK